MAVGVSHHIALGGREYLVRQGTYRKAPAPLFGARFTTGDPDYNNLSFWQHWVQTCWVGGIGAPTWQDDAMCDTAVGVDHGQHEVLALARDLGPATNRAPDNWTLGAAGSSRQFVEFNGKLYVLEMSQTTANNRLWRYNPGTDNWTLVKTFTEWERGVCAWADKLWFGDGGTVLTYMNPDETFGTKAKPTGRTETPYFMAVFRDRMYVGFGRYLWRMKPDLSWDGGTAFHEAVGVNYFAAMEPHQGFLYLASQNGRILRTDHNVTQDIWGWDAGVSVTGLRSYDGKLFVATAETGLDGVTAEGVLYQFTGAAVTELKRWGKVGANCTMGKLRVARRRLLYGAGSLLGMDDGFGIGVYDAVEDAHGIFASNRDDVSFPGGTAGVNWAVDDVIHWGGYLFCLVRGYGAFKTRWTWADLTAYQATYDTTAAGAAPGSGNGGFLVSSDFDAGTPGLRKLWRRIVLHVDLPTAATSVTVDYSLDGGATWTTAGTATKTSAATRYATVFDLAAVTGTRFKYRLTLRTTDATRTPQVRGVIVSYLPQPDPNWQWQFVLPIVAEYKALDGSDGTMDTNAVLADLEAQYRAGATLSFTDVDGQAWEVLLTDVTENLRYIGPASEGGREGDVQITLVEAHEAV